MKESDHQIDRSDSDDDKSCASDGQTSSFSIATMSDFAGSSCADSFVSYESTSMQSSASHATEFTDRETKNFMTGSSESNLKKTAFLVKVNQQISFRKNCQGKKHP